RPDFGRACRVFHRCTPATTHWSSRLLCYNITKFPAVDGSASFNFRRSSFDEIHPASFAVGVVPGFCPTCPWAGGGRCRGGGSGSTLHRRHRESARSG